MTRCLSGKVALVTGGARGIGAAIAKAFAAEGAAVAITYHEHGAEASSVVADVVAAGGRIAAIKADVASEEDAALSVRETISRFGALDVLVNNAGVILEKPLLETTAADFDWLMSINLRGTFMTGREAIRHMALVGSGRIINIASDLGYFGREQFSQIFMIRSHRCAGVSSARITAACIAARSGFPLCCQARMSR